MADSALVPQVNADADRCPDDSSSSCSSSSVQEEQGTQAREEPATNSLPFVRRYLLDRGFSEQSIEIMCASWRGSSAKQYQVYLKKWLRFCSSRKIDPLSVDEIVVISFLTHLYNQGVGYSALNTARSALSTILNCQGTTIGNFPSVKRFVKGVFELRPTKPRYYFIWDVNIVLNFLKNFYPNQDIPLSY